MPAISALVVADATPTNKTLYPLSASIASSRFAERGAQIVAGDRTAELKMSLATSQRKTDRVTVLYARPNVQDVDGVPTVTSTARFSAEFVIPTDLSTADRGHLYAEAKNLIANAIIQAYVKDRDPCF